MRAKSNSYEARHQQQRRALALERLGRRQHTGKQGTTWGAGNSKRRNSRSNLQCDILCDLLRPGPRRRKALKLPPNLSLFRGSNGMSHSSLGRDCNPEGVTRGFCVHRHLHWLEACRRSEHFSLQQTRRTDTKPRGLFGAGVGTDGGTSSLPFI